MTELLSHDEVVARLRERCRGKQAALAAEAGVSEAYVSRVFRGLRPPGPDLRRLAGVRNAEIACRRLSLQIERQAVTLCGADDVVVFMDFGAGPERLAPKLPEHPERLRQALAA